jgi:hypothetical protein
MDSPRPTASREATTTATRRTSTTPTTSRAVIRARERSQNTHRNRELKCRAKGLTRMFNADPPNCPGKFAPTSNVKYTSVRLPSCAVLFFRQSFSKPRF